MVPLSPPGSAFARIVEQRLTPDLVNPLPRQAANTTLKSLKWLQNFQYHRPHPKVITHHLPRQLLRHHQRVSIISPSSLIHTIRAASNANSATTSTTSNTTTINGSGGNGTPQSIPLTTTQINSTVTYASVDVTIINAQKASSFSDDNGYSNSPYLVRLNIKEHNPTTGSVYLFYNDNLHLILPDGTSVAATSEHDTSGIGQAVTRTNWVDFPVSTNVDVSKLTVRFGGANEAQMNVPLTGSADVSKYQLKTITPNSTFTYAGLNWTLTTTTSSWSANGKQAGSGMRYIVVTLKANNPTQSNFYVFPSDYVRLKSDTTTSSPTDNTFSSSIAAGTTGSNGTVTFLMPQNASSFTLVMLPRTDVTPSATQVTTNFQI